MEQINESREIHMDEVLTPCELKLKATAALLKEISKEKEEGDPDETAISKIIQESLLCTSPSV